MPPRQPQPDPYAVLGVDAGATQEEIRRAYRALARQHHPDLNRHRQAEAEHAIKRLNAAYDLLRDERKRAEYDQERRRTSQPAFNRASQPAMTPAEAAAWRARRDAQGTFFNRWQERRRDFEHSTPPPRQARARNPETAPPHGPTETHEIRLTFKQAVRGVTKSLTVGVGVSCRLCDGTGRVEAEPPPRCGSCRRQGLRSITTMGGQTLHLCKFCGWSEEGSVRCPGCAGTGRGKGRRIRLAIPPGLHDGALLRHKVQGLDRPVMITVRVGGSKTFQRGTGETEDQLLTTVAVPRDVASLGGRAKVPTIEGSVTVKVPPGISDGTCMKLSGRGVKRRDGTFGDLVVRFEIAKGKGRHTSNDQADE